MVESPGLLSRGTRTEVIHLAFRLIKVNRTLHLLLLNLTILAAVPVTGLASGTPTNATEAYAHNFALTVSTTLTCDVPVPASCEANDNGLNSTEWDAFRVILTFFFLANRCPPKVCF